LALTAGRFVLVLIALLSVFSAHLPITSVKQILSLPEEKKKPKKGTQGETFSTRESVELGHP
jgi:hypothetical protein